MGVMTMVGIQVLIAVLLLIALSIYLCLCVNWFTTNARTRHWRVVEASATNKAASSAMQAQTTLGFRLNQWQRFSKRYCMDTGLWYYCPWFSPVYLIGGSLLSGLWLGHLTWGWFQIEGLVVSGFILGFVTPLQVLNLWKAYRAYQLTCALPGFYGVLCRWAQIQPDIYYCFGQLERSGLPPRVTEPFTKFLKASTGGMSQESAFLELSQRTAGTPLQHFIRCLERLLSHRGDLPKLLQGFEAEAYQLQHEVTKRKMTQLKYKLLINGLCMGAFILMYALLKTNRVLSSFYVETWMGKALLSGLAGLLVLSFMGGLRYDDTH